MLTLKIKWAAGIAIVLSGLAGVVVAQVPPLGAYVCPRCYGFKEVEPHVYADVVNSEIPQMIAAATARVKAYFGDVSFSPPVWIVCQTDACHARMGGGGARARTYNENFVYVAPRGIDVTFFTHELTHVLVHHHLGAVQRLMGTLPAWFDEGLAVIVSQDPRYLDADGHVMACDGVTADQLPVSGSDWSYQAGHGLAPTLYHDAACVVEARIAKAGSWDAALDF